MLPLFVKWPFQPGDFSRQDESQDTYFYGEPRLVYHIDDNVQCFVFGVQIKYM